MNMPSKGSPRAFVSYSHDDDAHKTWVRQLAERLRGDGVDATIDQWGAVPGDQLPAFMERSIVENDFVLVVCTPRYKRRADQRLGGVGYEGDIITGELLQGSPQRKFIPLLRRGEWIEAAPAWCAGKYYVDLREGSQFEVQYQDLISTISGTRPKPPEVRKTRLPSAGPLPGPQALTVIDEGPVRIVGVIVDEVTEPRNDGTRGSALYKVPFKLSRAVSSTWAQIFESVWNHPPSFTSMHRPGIAHVHGDRIILDGTTIEEVKKYHRNTLELCVKRANDLFAEQQDLLRRNEEARARQSEEHRQRVADVSSSLNFDDDS